MNVKEGCSEIVKEEVEKKVEYHRVKYRVKDTLFTRYYVMN